MPRIHHPHPSAGRVRFLGVEFIDGVAVVDELHPERERALIQHGATIEIEGVPLEALTKVELVTLIKTEGLTAPKSAKKADLIELLNAAPVEVLEVNGTAHDLGDFAAHIVPLTPDEE